MTTPRYVKIDELLAIAAKVNGTEHGVRDLGLLASAVERPQTDVFGTEMYPSLHEKAAALLHAVARNHALIDGNERTAWLAMRFFLRINGLPAGHPVPPADEAGPFVEAVAQDHVDVTSITKRLADWFPVA
ncbi:toxin [Streptomyces triticagri]|uniref:Toxin n=1 Tax=Streptomyces triticagri TaxID=2293568 RepID=A0A372M757_9ACTN|nr:Fic family protein [Streptomyces triticagri]RFU86420.1 toxin [Streptomyces triticagri]